MERIFFEPIEEAFKKAKEKIKEERVYVEYFGEKILIDLNSKKFLPDLKNVEKILILHYITGKSDQTSEEMITFKELPEGSFYFPSIYSRIYLPIIEKYGENVKGFLEKGVEKGGERVSEFSIKFKIFPEVFYIFEIIPPDDEFPADLKVFFNKTASKIFPIEDLVIIGEIIISKFL